MCLATATAKPESQDGGTCVRLHTQIVAFRVTTLTTVWVLNYTHNTQTGDRSVCKVLVQLRVVCMSSRNNRKVTYLTDEEAALLSEWADESGKTESALLREAIMEYLDRDRSARIESKVDELLDRIPEGALSESEQSTHTHKPETPMLQQGSKSIEKARRIMQRLQQNNDAPVVKADVVDRAIEDIAGLDDRTKDKYKDIFKRRGLLFAHPGESEVWTFETDTFLTWLEDYMQLNGQQAAEDVAQSYPVAIRTTNKGLQIEYMEQQ